MDSSDMAECPVDSCDYGPQPVSSVAAHYSGKKPATGHEGGYERAMALLDGTASPSASEETAEPEPAEQQPDDLNQAEQATGEAKSDNPVMDGPEPEPNAGTQRNGQHHPEDDVDDECPNCGGELIDTRNVNLLEGEDGRQYDVPDDFYCSECGQGWIQE